MRVIVAALAAAALSAAAAAPAPSTTAQSATAQPPRPLLHGGWAALREAHAGRPTVVHFWGLTCGPCLAEMPQWRDFARQRGDLDLVMVDADPVAVAPDDIAGTLQKAGLGHVESWQLADPFTERIEYEIDPNWHGELPYTLLIGGDGKVEPILGAVDFTALAGWGRRQGL